MLEILFQKFVFRAIEGTRDGADAVGSPLDDAKGLDVVASAPLRENSYQVIHDAAIRGVDEIHAASAAGEARQARRHPVPDFVRDLRNAARPSLPVNLDEFHPRHTRTGGENMKNEAEAD